MADESKIDELLGLDPSDADDSRAVEAAAERQRVMSTLVAIRKQRGLSQADVARRLETQQSTVSDLERPGSNPTFRRLFGYAGVVGARLRVGVSADSDYEVVERQNQARRR